MKQRGAAVVPQAGRELDKEPKPACRLVGFRVSLAGRNDGTSSCYACIVFFLGWGEVQGTDLFLFFFGGGCKELILGSELPERTTGNFS